MTAIGRKRNGRTWWLAAFPSRGRAGQCPSLVRALPTFRSDQPRLLERELDLRNAPVSVADEIHLD